MITLNMADAISTAQDNFGKNNVTDNIVTFSNNVVTVNLGTPKGYSYSFFNNITITSHYLDKTNNQYIFFIGNYNG